MKNTKNINNWDLVDISCPHIVGDFLSREGVDILKMLAKSNNLWERRISVVSTFALIKKRNLGESLALADMLLHDEHDLIHKAVGWMLREVGKKNIDVLEIFLSTRYKNMPRTMLRYAIEKFPEEKRKKYLRGEI
jgi:3-methyladenine DNA glycosylase AlkD